MYALIYRPILEEVLLAVVRKKAVFTSTSFVKKQYVITCFFTFASTFAIASLQKLRI